LNQKTFLTLPVNEILAIVQRESRPKVGVFVPDGSRRLVLAFTDAKPGTEEFYRLSATLAAQYLLKGLKVFFEHGLPTLLVPILSRSVLNRGKDYRFFTVLEGLKLLFKSNVWMKFYNDYDVRVKVYGEPQRLGGTECEEALEWIKITCQQTSSHRSHTLFFAIGESPVLGQDIANSGIEFYKRYGRVPTFEEQIQEHYEENIEPADFFIMTSKMSGMGALPRFLVNSDTEVYFLPAPGAFGLNTKTYRQILYDLIFIRKDLRFNIGNYDNVWNREHSITLQKHYQQTAHFVIGLGRGIGNIWVPKV